MKSWGFKREIFDQLVQTSPTKLSSVVDGLIELKKSLSLHLLTKELKKIPQHKIKQTVQGILKLDSTLEIFPASHWVQPISFVPLGKLDKFLDRFSKLPYKPYSNSAVFFLSNLEDTSFQSIISMGSFYKNWDQEIVEFLIQLMTILPDETERNLALQNLEKSINKNEEISLDSLLSLQGNYEEKILLHRNQAEKLNEGVRDNELTIAHGFFEDYWNNVFFEDMCHSFREYNKSSLSNQEIMKTLFPKVEEWNVPSITEAQDKFYELAKSGRPYAKLFNPEPNFFTYEDYFMHVMLPQISDSFREYNKSPLSNQKIMKALFPKVKEGEVPSIPMAQDKFYELAKSGRPYARIFLSGPYGLPEGY